MIKNGRAFFVVGLLILGLSAIPVSKAVAIKSSTYSFLKHPIRFSRDVTQVLSDLFHFHSNAEELRKLGLKIDAVPDTAQTQELLLENQRLTQLLSLSKVLPANTHEVQICRVIGRSPSAWNRVFLVDKGNKEGIKVNMPVLSVSSLIGKVVEVGPRVSKILLISDPNSHMGAIIQRTRDQGVLYGTFSGECRMKYISVDAKIEVGDSVVSAGYGGLFPSGLLIGTIEKVWKEPGQIYQVAIIKPSTELGRIEEVACLV